MQELPAIKIHKTYIQRRVLLFGIIPVIAAGSVLFFYVQEKVLFILLWTLIAWFFPWLFQRKFRLWPGNNALQIRKGIFGRHELILKWDKIQSVHLKQSLYQQKHKLATIELNTASGTVTIPYITLQVSRQIQNFALYKMESSTWS